jgi:cellulose synthase/poly-beta-1,6-N-acetylglucosamine synthase-like glycosyltransferase
LTVLRHTLISLVEQNHKPDRIVLCISKEPYLIDEGINALPEWLHAMIERDEVELSWVKNIGPYRKLIPVYQQASDDDWIVTCDDDVIYGPNWLSSLVLSGQEYPSAIVCGRARRPAVNPWGRRQSYLNWQLVSPGSRGTELLPIGVAGVLYTSTFVFFDSYRSSERCCKNSNGKGATSPKCLEKKSGEL